MTACIGFYYLIDPRLLVPTEETDIDRLEEVECELLKSGRWRCPVAAQKDALFIMDGHHRLEVSRRLQLEVIPVVLLDYTHVHVEAWRPAETVTAEHIWSMYRSGGKFPSKTTRHVFHTPLPGCDIPLDALRHAQPVLRHRPQAAPLQHGAMSA
ncbi:hypothetical protein [Roseibium sediminicola]|uniref:ParB-like N-terminal domain-containing protein n=1 Tax=Roseibium sediminicola TaxID=2933272 RepID=A0ABT0H2X7_9HYPH|nr:hypothetical protein [Roseibium sp. CAU 1639]MCK7616029.1 hypothetical protein [Roseibium sp. CAU 1639]